MKASVLVIGFLATVFGASMTSAAQAEIPITMEDKTQQVGLLAHIGPATTSGFFDFNLDGAPEPFFVSHDRIISVRPNEEGVLTTFEIMTADGPGHLFTGKVNEVTALVTLDVDRDGQRDLMIVGSSTRIYTPVAPDVLLQMDVGIPPLPTASIVMDASAGDLNNDGWPDVVVSQGRFLLDHMYAIGSKDIVLMNRGGHFEFSYLKPETLGLTHGLSLIDIDFDGRLDIVESKDFSQAVGYSRVLLNRTEPGAREPTFEVSTNRYDKGSFGMGAAVADIDQDGYIDIFNASQGRDFLLAGQADGSYVDVTFERGLQHFYGRDGERVQWGPTILDLNADGRLDLFIRHGHVDLNPYAAFGFSSQPEPNLIYRQEEDGRFTRLPVPFDPTVKRSGYDVAAGDINGDRLPDIAMGSFQVSGNISNEEQPTIWMNTSVPPTEGRQVTVRLDPTVSADPPTGAVVTGTCDGVTWTRHYSTGGKMRASQPIEVYLAFAKCEAPIDLSVQWPSGVVSKHSVPVGEDLSNVVEPDWQQVKPAEEGGFSLMVGSQGIAEQAVCFGLEIDGEETCCATGENCTYPFTADIKPGAWIRVGDSAPMALPSVANEVAVFTDPYLPGPGEVFTFSVRGAGLAWNSEDLPWLRAGGVKIPWTSEDLEARILTTDPLMPIDGDFKASLFVGGTPFHWPTIPSGKVVDPRYSDHALFPYQDKAALRNWTFTFSSRPDINEADPKLLEIRLSNGEVIQGSWNQGFLGQERVVITWAKIPPGNTISFYDNGELRFGPLPAYPFSTNEWLAERIDSIRGISTRRVLVEDGDVTLMVFSMLDANGHPIPPDPDLITLVPKGLVVEKPLEAVNQMAWELTTTIRTLPGVGEQTLDFVTADGRTVGTWTFETRPEIQTQVDLTESSVALSHDELPTGVGATGTVSVIVRNEFGERLGEDIDVRIEAPDFIRVEQPKVNTGYTYEATIEPGFKGGTYPITVTVNGEVLATEEISIVGPALPDMKVEATFADPLPSTADPAPPEVEPIPPTSTGCTTSSNPASAWLFLMLLVGTILRRLRRRGAR